MKKNYRLTQKGKNGKAKSCLKGVVEEANELLAGYELTTAQELEVAAEQGLAEAQINLNLIKKNSKNFKN